MLLVHPPCARPKVSLLGRARSAQRTRRMAFGSHCRGDHHPKLSIGNGNMGIGARRAPGNWELGLCFPGRCCKNNGLFGGSTGFSVATVHSVFLRFPTVNSLERRPKNNGPCNGLMCDGQRPNLQ
eukprot:gene11344-biopygen19879